jgi:monothiol glutaredoxin
MDEIQQQIDKLVHEHDIILFMKGTPQFPQCGFSQRVTQILGNYGVPYVAVNVLLDPAVREGIKAYTNWPTIPQLYVKGEFVGGCDIVTEMHDSGELHELLDPFHQAG